MQLASFTPSSFMDYCLLYADPMKATAVLGIILAAILLFWGAVWFFFVYLPSRNK